MDVLIIVEVISLLTTVVGLIQLGNKDKRGFILFSISLFCQAILFYVDKKWFLLLQMVILIIFNTLNYFKWKKEEKNNGNSKKN